MSVLRPTRYSSSPKPFRFIEYEVAGSWKCLTGVSGIYSIRIGKFTYIGQSVNVLDRVRAHRTQINNSLVKGVVINSGYAKMMNAIWTQPEVNVIKVDLLEAVTPDLLNEREKFWIAKAICKGNCMNTVIRK